MKSIAARIMPLIMLSMLLVVGSAAANEDTKLVLHAVDTAFAPCNAHGVDCGENGPTIDVTGMDTPAVYLLVYDYTEIVGVQCAFDWDPSWVFTFGLWDCQSNQVNGFTPSAPGETNGTITTAFDALTGGAVEPVGRMNFAGATSGCLTIIDSSFPFGTHVVDATGQDTPIPEGLRGAIYVGPGGHDGCTPLPVEPGSWGQIKRQYEHQ
jgi:hypothetical protein